MANQTPNADLFQAWKQLYDEYESTWSKATQEMLESETFTKTLTQTREQYLSGRKMSKEALEKHWESLRIPTKTDVARVAGLVTALENKIDALEDAQDTLSAHLNRIESKLDALLGSLAVKAPAEKPPVAKATAAKVTAAKAAPRKAPTGRSKSK